MFRIAVCDDETYFLKELRNRLNAYFLKQPWQPEIALFTAGEELLDANAQNPFDVAFLDIEMPGIDGVALGRALRACQPGIFLIFVTSHDSYVGEAFRLGAFQYLKKPVDDEYLTEEMDRIMAAQSLRQQDYIFDYGGVKMRIPLSEIIYLESKRWNVFIYTRGETFKMVSTLGKAAPWLEQHHFVRIHQSYLVNMAYIRQFRSDRVALGDPLKRILPVGRKYKDTARAVFLVYQSKVGI